MRKLTLIATICVIIITGCEDHVANEWPVPPSIPGYKTQETPSVLQQNPEKTADYEWSDYTISLNGLDLQEMTPRSVVDGDTVYFSESTRSNRLVSVDTPESKYGSKLTSTTDACGDNIKQMGKEASDFTNNIFTSEASYLVEEHDKDQYGRPVVSIYTKDGHSLSVELVAKGYAVPEFFDHGNDEEKSQILNALDNAKSNELGLWKNYYSEMECLENLY